MSFLINATGEELTVGSPATLDNIILLTVHGWINVTVDSVQRRIFDKMFDGTTVTGWEVLHRNFDDGGGAKDRIQFSRGWSTAVGQWQTASVPSGWFHLAVSYDRGSTANSPLIYFDGVSQSVNEFQSPTGTILDDAVAEFTLGNINHGTVDSARNLNGRMARASVHNVILTPGEIKAAMIGPVYRGRIGYWRMENSGVDLSGNKNNATVTNATVANDPPVPPYSARFWGHGPLIEAAVAGVVGGAYYQQYHAHVIAA